MDIQENIAVCWQTCWLVVLSVVVFVSLSILNHKKEA